MICAFVVPAAFCAEMGKVKVPALVGNPVTIRYFVAAPLIDPSLLIAASPGGNAPVARWSAPVPLMRYSNGTPTKPSAPAPAAMTGAADGETGRSMTSVKSAFLSTEDGENSKNI